MQSSEHGARIVAAGGPTAGGSGGTNAGARAGFAVVVGLCCAGLTYALFWVADSVGGDTDFEFWYRATRALVQGRDPYAFRPFTPPLWPLRDRLFYPMPALLLTLPVVWLPLRAAGAVFIGAACAVLAYIFSAPRPDGTPDGRIYLLFGLPLVWTMQLGQWSPWLCVAAVVPWLGFLAAAKPTLGLAVLGYGLDRRAILGAAALAVVSLAVAPRWPAGWLDNLRSVKGHPSPVMTFGGPLLLLSALRWRTPEGRLLLGMACVPQLLEFADQLPLGLAARTRNEGRALLACGSVAVLAWGAFAQPTWAEQIRAARPYVMLGMYLPTLIVVLRRPNQGPAPAWLEAALLRWRVPRSLRGAHVPETVGRTPGQS
jgi:hypothetical protein